MSDGDPRRQQIIRTLSSDEWMERHFGIAAHAHDVADAVLPILDEAIAAERERIAAAIEATEHRCGECGVLLDGTYIADIAREDGNP